MQFFLYNASTSDPMKVYYLNQFLHVFEDIAPKIISASRKLQ